MSALPKQMLTVSQFLDWSQNRHERYELQDGLVVTLQSEARRLVHQVRAADGLYTRILHVGELRLDPPGLKVNVADFFG